MARSENRRDRARIGILGGTFDPVHTGHIKLAQEALAKLHLDKVIFIPAYISPHKTDKDAAPCRDRYEMVKLAVNGVKHLEISDIEIKRKAASYSIDTVKEIRAAGGACEIFFIAGSDSVAELESWKGIDELKGLCTFVIATRPGYGVEPRPKDTVILDADTPNISSTDIRARIKKGEPFEEFTPHKVHNYIINKRLYV